MLKDCPHCYARVVPKSDGRCPACQKDMQNLAGADTTRASLRVAQGDVLPSICCGCGQSTDRFVKVHKTRSGRDEPSAWVKVLLFFTFNWGVMSGGGKDVVEVKIPQCDFCGNEGRPEPDHVDFDNVRMTFVVHKNLRNATAP
jgi:hypothetical protein